MSDTKPATADEIVEKAARAYDAPRGGGHLKRMAAALKAVGVLDENGKPIPTVRLDDIPETAEQFFQKAGLKTPQPREPIPEDTFWTEGYGFATSKPGQVRAEPCSVPFYDKWWGRRREFPSSYHALKMAQKDKAMKAKPEGASSEPIPEGYYWIDEQTGFTCPALGGLVPEGFDEKWHARRAEFPTWADYCGKPKQAKAEGEAEGAADAPGRNHARAGEPRCLLCDDTGLLNAPRGIEACPCGRGGRIKGKRTMAVRMDGGWELMGKLIDGHMLRIDCEGRTYHCTEALWLKGQRFVFKFEEQEEARP